MSKLVFYSIKEISEMFNIHRNTIKKLIDSGELKASKIGGSYRVLEKNLYEYLEKNKVGG